MKVDSRTVGVFEENCYLVGDDASGRAILIDPGDDGDQILEMIRESGMTLDAIWLTHAHLDHIGAINTVRGEYEVPVRLHRLDLPYYEQLSARAAQMYGLPWDQPDIAPEFIEERDVLRVGALEFSVMHVPGHAPGHVAFVGEGVALSGDLLFSGSIGRTDLPLCDPYAMDVSLDRFATLPAETIVHPGHGPLTTIRQELASNPFLSGKARVLKR